MAAKWAIKRTLPNGQVSLVQNPYGRKTTWTSKTEAERIAQEYREYAASKGLANTYEVLRWV